MLNFKLIEKKDINYFKQFYDYSEAFGCDANLLNAYLWRNEYNIKFAVFEDTLIKAYFKDDGTVWGYCMPTGKNVKQALEQIFLDAQQRGQEPHIVMLTNAQREVLESICPTRFEFVRSPENQDYIYLTKDLVMLVGKKFHAKRNHISRFYKTYTDTHFETIDNSNEQDALQVVRDWCEENGYNPKGYEELAVIKEALEMRRDFGLSGAVLYVDDKPVAMTLGSEISDKVYDINFEKASRQYDGAYAVINNEFAKTLTSYEYINREEDMGIEGLRKSKLSYNPVIILDRFNATLK